MKTRTLFTMFLSLALVVAFTASAFATVWAGDATLRNNSNPWSFTSTSAASAGDTFKVNFTAVGSWDGAGYPGSTPTTWTNGSPSGTTDSFTIEAWLGTNRVAFQTIDTIDNPDNRILAYNPDYPTDSTKMDTKYDMNTAHWFTNAQSIELLLPTTGVYTFKALSLVTAGNQDEHWTFDGASVTPTPLPAAVWMLGSGLLGFMGFKRTRKNAA